jgi:hypothetical protein
MGDRELMTAIPPHSYYADAPRARLLHNPLDSTATSAGTTTTTLLLLQLHRRGVKAPASSSLRDELPGGVLGWISNPAF